jgi:thiol-disulfide isomerase/thioredoxin
MRFFALAVMLLLAFGCVAESAKAPNQSLNKTGNATVSSQSGTPPENLSPKANESNPADAGHPVNFTISREIRGDILTTDTKFPVPPHFDFSNITTSDGRLIVYYFYSQYCSACNALRPEIDKLKAKSASVEWIEYDIANQNGSIAYGNFADQKNLSMKERLVPQVLVNGTVITDRFKINDTLGSVIERFSAT